jgi:hypothetical protein
MSFNRYRCVCVCVCVCMRRYMLEVRDMLPCHLSVIGVCVCVCVYVCVCV